MAEVQSVLNVSGVAGDVYIEGDPDTLLGDGSDFTWFDLPGLGDGYPAVVTFDVAPFTGNPATVSAIRWVLRLANDRGDMDMELLVGGDVVATSTAVMGPGIDPSLIGDWTPAPGLSLVDVATALTAGGTMRWEAPADPVGGTFYEAVVTITWDDATGLYPLRQFPRTDGRGAMGVKRGWRAESHQTGLRRIGGEP